MEDYLRQFFYRQSSRNAEPPREMIDRHLRHLKTAVVSFYGQFGAVTVLQAPVLFKQKIHHFFIHDSEAAVGVVQFYFEIPTDEGIEYSS